MRKELKELQDMLKELDRPSKIVKGKNCLKVYVEGKFMGSFTPGKDGTFFGIKQRIKHLKDKGSLTCQ